LTGGNDISLLNLEAWRAVDSGVGVSLLETVVLLDVVEVVAANDNSSSHLGGNNHSSEDSTTDGNITSEWALLVDVSTVDGLLWSNETKTNVLPPTLGLLGSDTNWSGVLSLESLLSLVSHINLLYNRITNGSEKYEFLILSRSRTIISFVKFFSRGTSGPGSIMIFVFLQY